MKYNEIVERHAPILGLNDLVTGKPCKPFVYMGYVDDGMWVHYVIYCENISKQKQKRCLAMAEMCNASYDKEDAIVNGSGTSWEYISKEMKYWERWRNKWLELADKFKEDV